MPIPRLLLLLLLTLPAVATAAPLRVTGSLAVMNAENTTQARIELYPAWESYEDAVRRLAEGKREPEPVASAIADEHGSFEIEVPTSGVFRLTARREDHVAIEMPLLALTEDTDLGPIPLPMAKPLEVRVAGPDGRPAAGIGVRINHEEDRRFRRMSGPEDPPRWRVSHFAVSGKDGKLLLPAADHFGTPRLTVLSPGFLGQTATLSWAARKEPPVVLSLKTRNVRIEVRDREGRPVPGALLRWEGRPLAVTGPDDRLEIDVPEGDTAWTVENREGWRARVAVPPGTSGIVPVRLEPPRKITGKVVETDTGRPVAGALAWSGWPMAGPAIQTDAAGAFEVTGLSGGAWVSAAAPGFFAGERQPAGAAVLKLEPAATLLGRVVDSRGQPVAGTRITASPGRMRNRESQQPTSRSRADGSFRLTGLLYGGVYELSTWREGFARTQTPAKTAPRGKPPASVTIVLSDGQTAVGRVVDAAGNPVEGAEINLLSRALDAVESSATSGPEGRFELRRLEPGRKMLRAGHPDHAPAVLPQIEIPKGTPVVDVGTVALPASGAIEGRVTDSRGRPLEKAEVGIFPADRGMMPGWMIGRGRSGELRTQPDGTFRAGNLQLGARFNVTVRLPGYAAADTPGVVAPTAEPLRIELKAARTLSGQVVSPEGAPVPDAELTRLEESAFGAGSSSITLGATDEEGRFRLTGLAPGSFDLIVTADGYSARRLRGIPIPETGEPDDLKVVLERGAVLDVLLTDAEGRPVPDASVRAEPETPPDPEALPNHLFPQRLWMRTDAEGRCRLQISAPGTYEVTASRQHRSATAKVVAGLGATPVELRFPAGVEVSGRVLSPDGSPVPGTSVHFQRDGRGGPLAPTQADGTFLIEGLADGEYQLVARDRDGRSSRPLNLLVAGRSVTGLELVIDQESQRTTLSGRVSGLPPEALRGVRITAVPATPPSWDRSTETGSGGEYLLEKLDPGEWTVTARSPHGEAQGSVRLESGVPAVLDLEIAPGLTLSGRVLLDGAPLAGAEIRVMHRQGERGGFGTTAYDGTFKIHGLRPGPHTLLVADGRGLGGTRSFDLQESRDLAVEISTGRVRGRIVTESGEPVEDVEVSLHGLIPQELGETWFSTLGTRSGVEGLFEARLGAGKYRVRVQKPGFPLFEMVAEVLPGAETVVEIRLGSPDQR